MNKLHEPHDWPALTALGQEFDRLGTQPAPSRRPLAWSGGAVAGAAAFLAFTPPGQAVTERVGEILGFNDGGAIVSTGTTPDVQHPYSVSISGERHPGETCVFMEFDEAPGKGYGSCLAGPVPAEIQTTGFSPFVYPTPDGVLESGSLILQGVASAHVARVEVTYEAADGERISVPTDLTELSDPLLSEINVSDGRFNFFVAFLPPEAARTLSVEDVRPSDPLFRTVVGHLPGVTVSAYDETGTLVGNSQLDDLMDYEADLKGATASRK